MLGRVAVMWKNSLASATNFNSSIMSLITVESDTYVLSIKIKAISGRSLDTQKIEQFTCSIVYPDLKMIADVLSDTSLIKTFYKVCINIRVNPHHFVWFENYSLILSPL